MGFYFFKAFCEHTEDTNNINNVTEATGRDQKFENIKAFIVSQL